MSIFKNKILTNDKKREELILFIETQLKQLKEDYGMSIEFLEENKTINGFDVMIQEIKDEYLIALQFLNEEIQSNIQLLREEVDRINKNSRWMNSEKSIGNMDGLNRTIGRLMSISQDVEKAKGLLSVTKTEEALDAQPIGPQ